MHIRAAEKAHAPRTREVNQAYAAEQAALASGPISEQAQRIRETMLAAKKGLEQFKSARWAQRKEQTL